MVTDDMITYVVEHLYVQPRYKPYAGFINGQRVTPILTNKTAVKLHLNARLAQIFYRQMRSNDRKAILNRMYKENIIEILPITEEEI